MTEHAADKILDCCTVAETRVKDKDVDTTVHFLFESDNCQGVACFV